MKPSFLFILILCLGFCSFSQEELFRGYTVRDGLASNMVYSAIEDKNGFLWFATTAGVCRFDGTSFTNFSTNDGLTDIVVIGMFEDNDGRIWFVCYNQQPCFYFKGKIFNASNFKELQKIKSYNWHVRSINKDEVWLLGKDHIYRFKNDKFSEYSLPKADDVSLITSVDSTIYAIKGSVLFILDKNNEKFVPYSTLNIPVTGRRKIIEIGKGRYLLYQTDDQYNYITPYTIDLSNNIVTKKTSYVFKKEIVKLVPDRTNNILRIIFEDNTVIEKDISNDSFKTISEYNYNAAVSDIVIDKQGNKWVTFLHDGVEMFPKIRAYTVPLSADIKTPSTYYSIVGTNGQIIAGDNNNTLYFLANGKLFRTQHENFFPRNNRIRNMVMDKHNKLWIGMDDGVCIYDVDKKQFHPINIKRNIKEIKYDEANDLMLIASSQGLFSISCKDTSQVSYIVDNVRVTSVAGSLSDTCWYETLNGLYLYNGKTSVPETVFSPSFKNRITCMGIDKSKNLWVGTSSNGVFVVRSNKIIYHFTMADGLASNSCNNIFIDERNEAWICTVLGLYHVVINKDSFSINKYSDKNTLMDDQVNDVLVVKDTVYVVSSTGITFFNKRDIAEKYLFPIYITKVKVGNNEQYTTDSIFHFDSKQNTISISFSGLSYLSSGEIRYAYYIEELNDKPLFTKSNSITYSGLSPGTYNFYVSATDLFGNKSIRPAHIEFTIVPEWYQLIWLRWLAALALVAIAIFITFKYSKQHEKRKRLRSELSQTISRLELEAIHSQIKPHFIFNCLNAIQNAVYNNNVESASYFINRFAKLMRKALMLSKESFISIDEEYEFINNYLEVEKLRHNNRFDYSIEVDPALNKSASIVPAFVLQPFIENGINHGIKYLKDEKGLITLKFTKTDTLEIRLDDNGIGICASKKISENRSGHSSKGIELVTARIASLNKIYSKNIQIKIVDKTELDKNERGTTVILSINL